MQNLQNLQKRINEHKMFWWTVAILLGISFRFIVLYVTGNVDFNNFYRTAQLAADGRNIYANTRAYNYGSIISIILGKIYQATLYLGGSVLTFKIMYVAVLTLADFLIAMLVLKKAGSLWGMLFFLNPISMIVDGYHTQFDNIAVMLGAYGILYLEESCERENFSLNDMLGVMFLSLSLVTKHFMWAFPLYVLFSTKINIRKKILYAFVPPLIFFLSFVPYWSEGSHGIIQNVFMYRSFRNFPLLAVGLIKPNAEISTGVAHAFLIIFGFLMITSAYIFRRENIFNSFLIYTIAVVSFSSGASGQQLVIPCLAMLLLFHEKSLLYFTLIFTRLAGKQVMLTAEAWCLLAYLIVYYYKHKQRV